MSTEVPQEKESTGGEQGKEERPAAPNNDEPLFQCTICLESPVDPVVTMCGHIFCWECIREVFLYII